MRHFVSTLAFCVMGLMGCCLVGCGGNDQIIDDVVQQDGSKPAAPKISEIEGYLPPLDNGRVKIAPPKGWYTMPRKSKYLVRFTPRKGVSIPVIVVTVKPFDEIDEVTTENISEYVKLLDRPGKNLERRRINGFLGVSYLKQGTVKTGVKTILLDRKIFDTVVDHRQYRFELRTKEGSIEKFTPDLLAVATGTQFLKRKGVEELDDITAEEEEPETKAPPQKAPATAAPKPEPKPEPKPQPKTEPAKPAFSQPKPTEEASPEKTVEEAEPKESKPKKSRRRRRSSAFE